MDHARMSKEILYQHFFRKNNQCCSINSVVSSEMLYNTFIIYHLEPNVAFTTYAGQQIYS